MDTSEKYILMCSKAQEIQSMRSDYDNWETQDFCVKVGGNGCYCVESWSAEDLLILRLSTQDEGVFWLPRQDQLQEIALTSIVGRNWDTLRYVTRKTETKYFCDFDSFEKLWLAFAMQKRFDKVWDDNKQEWIKE